MEKLQCHTSQDSVTKSGGITQFRLNGEMVSLFHCLKGDLSECGNWRGITLLSVPGKIFASVVLDIIKKAVDNALRQEQAGFRPGRSCNDQIFTLRQILETVTAGRNPTIFNFIDLRKASDSVHRPALWKILRMYGFPEQIISILQNLLPGQQMCSQNQ